MFPGAYSCVGQFVVGVFHIDCFRITRDGASVAVSGTKSAMPFEPAPNLGCWSRCCHQHPYFPGKRYENWVLDDPAGLDLGSVRPIRDHIERKVLDLIANLDLAL